MICTAKMLLKGYKHKSYLEQAYVIITMLYNQAKKVPLNKFKDKPISSDLKVVLG